MKRKKIDPLYVRYSSVDIQSVWINQFDRCWRSSLWVTTTTTMKKLAIHFILVTSCLTISVCDGFLQLNRTDSAGVQFISAPYWLYATKLRPALETFHPAVRIWLNGVIGDRLATVNGFTKIISINGKRFPLIRRLIQSRIFRWIAILAFLKVAFSLFVIVVLPNIYFYAMTKMRDWNNPNPFVNNNFRILCFVWLSKGILKRNLIQLLDRKRWRRIVNQDIFLFFWPLHLFLSHWFDGGGRKVHSKSTIHLFILFSIFGGHSTLLSFYPFGQSQSWDYLVCIESRSSCRPSLCQSGPCIALSQKNTKTHDRVFLM